VKYYVKYARSARSRKHEQDCGAVRSLTRLVAWKRRSRERPGFVHAEQLYTDAALVLDASTRVPAAARSGLIDLHVAFASSTMQMGRINVLMLVMRGSSPCEPRVDLTRRAAIHRRSARAGRIYTCTSSRKKRPHRSALCTAAVRFIAFLALLDGSAFLSALNVINVNGP
jgi:hypothetical protein